MSKPPQGLARWLELVWSERGPDDTSTRAVLTAIALHFDYSTMAGAFPSYGTLQRRTGLSRDSICRHIKRAEGAGWLAVERSRTARGQPRNTYRALLPKSDHRTGHPDAPSPTIGPGPRKPSPTVRRGSPTIGPEAVRPSDPISPISSPCNKTRAREDAASSLAQQLQGEPSEREVAALIEEYGSRVWPAVGHLAIHAPPTLDRLRRVLAGDGEHRDD